MTIAERLSARDPEDLVDILYRLTGEDRPELDARALSLEISRVMEEQPERLRLCLGQQTLSFWRERLQAKKTDVPDEDLSTDNSRWRAVEELTRFGLCDERENGWMLDPACAPLSQARRREEERISRQDMLFNLTNGLLTWMGMLEMSVLVEQLCRLIPSLEEAEVREVLISRYGLQTWYRTEAAVPGDPDETWVCYPDLDQADMLLSELDDPDVTDLPYADVDVEALIRAHVTGIPADMPTINRCMAAMEQAGLAPEDALTLINDVVYEVENSGAATTGAEAVAAAFKGMKPQPPEPVIEALRVFCDALPRWALKGHTPDEAARLFRASRAGMLRPLVHNWDGPKMIAFPSARPAVDLPPDAPCPCGSGKPFGECHGAKS